MKKLIIIGIIIAATHGFYTGFIRAEMLDFESPQHVLFFGQDNNEEIFRVVFPGGYPETGLTEDNVFITFQDMYGQFSIRDILSFKFYPDKPLIKIQYKI